MDPARLLDPKIRSQLMSIDGHIDMLRKPEEGESALKNLQIYVLGGRVAGTYSTNADSNGPYSIYS
jgi:hypothetical protein